MLSHTRLQQPRSGWEFLAHHFTPVRFDDLNMDAQPYVPFVAYGNSKSANCLMSLEIERRYSHGGLHLTVLHPGSVLTSLNRHMDRTLARSMLTPDMITRMEMPDKGAARTVWTTVAKEWEGKGGKYLEDVSVAQPMQDPPLPLNGYLPHVYDSEAAERLWAESFRIVGGADDDAGAE